MWIFLWKTPLGYEFRAVGSNPEAARRAGISEKKIQILAMSIAGSMAAFVALSEVLGSMGQYRMGFSPDYGFMAIAVALLANNNPIAIILTAFLMGALHKGASDLDLETNVITRDFSKVIQAFVILGVAAQGYWHMSRKNKNSIKTGSSNTNSNMKTNVNVDTNTDANTNSNINTNLSIEEQPL